MARQQIIVNIQTWLNETYKDSAGYNPIEVNGLPGWDTTNAMLIAYQIEDGVSTAIINDETSSGIYDFTGEGFSPMSSGTDFSIQSNQNRLMILQGAFYVKGINPGLFGPTYNSEFSSAVSTLQSNAGIEATGVADLLVVKALLSMDAFTVLPQYGGVAEIAKIQRTLNAQYAYDMGSLIPCDGVYGRELNKALIYALQIQEGFSAAEANEADGYFGPGTQSKCPTLALGDANGFVTLLKYALYCNGYTGVDISSDTFGQATQTAIYEVQSFMGLSRTGEVGVDTWMALLLSSGNPNMNVTGCDAAQTLSLSDAQALKANGYQIVGRYISGEFITSVEELTNILNAGLNVFPIYETGSYQTSYFSAAQGTSDAIAAVEACRNFGIPEGTTIYFTVDYDMEGYQITSLVLPYFEAIYDKFNDAQLNYNIGIYGSRNVCSKVINAGYAQSAFVDGASTGYSGNMGFPMPKQWAFNQIKEGVTVDGVQVDNDVVSGLDSGFNSLGGGKVVNNILLTGPSYNNTSSNNIEIVSNSLKGLFQNIINIKSTDLSELLNFDKDKYKLSGGPFFFAGDTCYLKYDSGFKAQLGNGGDINVYFDTDEDGGNFNFDLLSGGAGSNVNIKTLMGDDDFEQKLSSLLPTVSKGQLQFYSCWQGNSSAEPGYWEFGVEIGFTIPAMQENEITDDGKLKTVQSLEGLYVFVDIIIGVKEDILLRSEDMNMSYNINPSFAFSFFVNTAYTLTNNANNNIIVNPQGDNLVLEFAGSIPKIVDILTKWVEHFIIGTAFILGFLLLLGSNKMGAIG